MALTAAQLLDELMGRDRNLVPGEKSNQFHWSHDDVCKHFLCRFCVNDLFVNTKADYGQCSKVHDDALKLEYEKSERYGRMGYEEDFARYLNTTQSDVERKIRRGHDRLLMNKVKEQEFAENDNDNTKMLTERINSVVKEIEQLGSDGKVEEAQGLSRLLDQLKEEKERGKMGPGLAGQEKQMEVCEVCGAFLIVGDVQSRVDDHLQGKQHLAYAKIKSTIEEMKERPWLKIKPKDGEQDVEMKKDEYEKEQSKEGEHEKEKERERDRGKERDRGERERDGERENRSHSRRLSDDHSREKRRSRSRSRDRHRERRRSRDRRGDRDRERRRSHDRDRDRRDRRDRDHDRDRDRDRDSRRSRRHSRSRSRSRERSRRRSRSRDNEKRSSRHSSRDRDRDRLSKEKTLDKQGGHTGNTGGTTVSEKDTNSLKEPFTGEVCDRILNNESVVNENNENSEHEYSNIANQACTSTTSIENTISDEANQSSQDSISTQSLQDDVANLPTQDYVSNLPTQDYTSNVFCTSNQSTPKYTSILLSEDFTSDSVDSVNVNSDNNNPLDVKQNYHSNNCHSNTTQNSMKQGEQSAKKVDVPFSNVTNADFENDDYM